MEAGGKIPAAPTETYLAAFQALHRLFGSCGATPITQSDESCYSKALRGNGAAVVSPTAHHLSQVCASRRMSLSRGVVVNLTDLGHAGPYISIAAYLDVFSVSKLDVSCRLFRDMNRTFNGPWFSLGMQKFMGLELVDEGIFTGDETVCCQKSAILGAFNQQFDWKCRIAHFHTGVRSFRAPFTGPEITEVQQADEIAYCCCQLRTDLLTDELSGDSLSKVYIEFEIRQNPDNVSLAVVDFEAGGCSSVTFSPDTGAVIRERKINETPRKVEGAYIQPLATITAGQGFEGSMGLYFCGGHLAFFRRHAYAFTEDAEHPSGGASDGQVVIGPWETTGFVTNLSWAEGCRLTPCLAFRNEGSYDARIVTVGTEPPMIPERLAAAYEEGNWSSLDWDATEQDVPEE